MPRNPWFDVRIKDVDLLRDYLHTEVGGAARRADVMTPEAEHSLAEVALFRLTYLYWPMLREQMRSLLIEENPLAGVSLLLIKGDTRREALRRAVEELLGDGFDRAFERYPELGRLDGIFRADLERIADEVCALVRSQRHEIAEQFFSRTDVGRITALSLPMREDPRTRPGGRMRLFVDTEAGRLVYKPHDLAHHKVFERIAGWLFPELGLDTKLLHGQDAWLMEFVPQDLPRTHDELLDYARHAGMEVALFCALGSTDLHRANFIPRGTVPVPVDLEQLLPDLGSSCSADPEKWLAVEMFPDDKRLSFLRIPLGEDKCACEYADSLLKGFADGFERIMECRTELLERLAQDGDMVLRSSVGTTFDMTFRILHRSFAEDCLVSHDARKAYFNRIGRRVQGKERQAIWAWERSNVISSPRLSASPLPTA